MDILVIGAGLVGSAIVGDLVKFYPDIDRVVVADIDFDKVVGLAESLGDRVEGIKLDVRDVELLKRVLADVDCVVNATYYGLAKYVLEASLETGTPYVDLGSSLYSYHDRFLEAGVTAVIDVGGAPGLINMLAKVLADEMDSIDYIHLYDVSREVRPPDRVNPIRWKYSIETILDEATMDAVVFRDGRFVKVPPFSGMEERVFPEPVGRARVFLIFHPEVLTLAETYLDKGVREVWYKIDAFNLPWDEGMKWRLLAELGLASREPVSVDGVEVVPRDVLLALLGRLELDFRGWRGYEMLRAEVSGYVGGEYRVLDATAVAEVGWDTGSLLMSVPPSIVAYWLARVLIDKPGAYPVERILDADEFFRELGRRPGIKLDIGVWR